MNADIEEQEDELLALESIFDSEEFVRNESKFAGEIRACVELPAGFNVLLKEGDTLRQYEISFLPPVLLTFELPEDYPSCCPPSFILSCSWLTHTQLSAVSDQLTDLYQATGGAVVLFSWVQFLKEDALKFLGIHTLLELPSEEHSLQEPSNAALLEPKNNHSNPKSEPTVCNVSDLCKPDLSARSLEEENPRVFLTDGHDHSNQISSDASEAKQISEFTADHQNDLSSAAGKLKHGQEEFLNEGDVSASLLLPPSSSDLLDQSEQGAASLPHSSESSQNEDQTLSGLSLTPSQTLLSQLLIHNAAQKQKMFATTVFDCGVCFEGWLGSDCVQLPECGHIFCRACLGKFCKLQIKEGNVRGVTCPDADCPATPTPALVRSLVGEELFDRYDHLLLQSTLDCMGDVVYCPRTSCGSAVIVEMSSRAAQCSVCGFAFCVSCKKTYHGTEECRAKKSTKTQEIQLGIANLPQSQEGLMALWDDYASGSKQRQRLLENRYGRKIMRETVEDCLSEDWIVFNSKNCPHCFCRIQKNRGCNMMTCSKCLNRFCWACLDRLQTGANQHFVDSRCAADYREF
ncbi:E3 ubiquitin-protein ligase RNF14-like [Pseudochaenichthys georgianus]|uniref:E3 ubiquitin-protein ligase RNF14-like n=1 Tax=Pseudochaenichthys georgianus TaxID=52239 RepID=UPI00146D3F54|nr:E3 ubiquitin-protein ligase RNF14-like [Pseudochaenichthys georgianus]XP_033937334.1 E3 ubiquitin-protein ligase RNF14-like [Pseudochaenichthys georgianus]XP_033937335.1 E3 ubiquitin-protein ligase RNF14-like [Pseudochaenichthys georgianus]XP_033937337.1 E3 ubiquitin-protein ligase RNF14-like [Pseudochaenichthys georgianus]